MIGDQINESNYQGNPYPVLIIGALIVGFLAIKALGIVGIDSYDELIGGTDELVPVYIMPFNLSVTADGGVEVPLPTDNIGMPSFPNCLESDDCEWNARARTTVIDGEETVVIEAELREAGDVIGRVQHMRVNPAEFEQLHDIAAQGHKYVWVSHIEVYEPLWGNGIGKAMWFASDAILKLFAGSGAVHVFADQAGWGPAIMRHVPVDSIILEGEQLWAYLIR